MGVELSIANNECSQPPISLVLVFCHAKIKSQLCMTHYRRFYMSKHDMVKSMQLIGRKKTRVPENAWFS